MKAFAFAFLLIAVAADAADNTFRFFTPQTTPKWRTIEPEVIPIVPEPRRSPTPRYYICPTDETMVRVPHASHTGDVKCPIDGTVMKQGRGRTSTYFLLQ